MQAGKFRVLIYSIIIYNLAMGSFYKIEGEHLYLNLKVLPGTSRTALTKVNDDRLKIKIAAAPEDGKANDELCAFLSKTLKVPKRDIEIVSGEKSRIKTLKLPAVVKSYFEKYNKE